MQRVPGLSIIEKKVLETSITVLPLHSGKAEKLEGMRHDALLRAGTAISNAGSVMLRQIGAQSPHTLGTHVWDAEAHLPAHAAQGQKTSGFLLRHVNGLVLSALAIVALTADCTASWIDALAASIADVYCVTLGRMLGSEMAVCV